MNSRFDEVHGARHESTASGGGGANSHELGHGELGVGRVALVLLDRAFEFLKNRKIHSRKRAEGAQACPVAAQQAAGAVSLEDGADAVEDASIVEGGGRLRALGL